MRAWRPMGLVVLLMCTAGMCGGDEAVTTPASPAASPAPTAGGAATGTTATPALPASLMVAKSDDGELILSVHVDFGARPVLLEGYTVIAKDGSRREGYPISGTFLGRKTPKGGFRMRSAFEVDDPGPEARDPGPSRWTFEGEDRFVCGPFAQIMSGYTESFPDDPEAPAKFVEVRVRRLKPGRAMQKLTEPAAAVPPPPKEGEAPVFGYRVTVRIAFDADTAAVHPRESFYRKSAPYPEDFFRFSGNSTPELPIMWDYGCLDEDLEPAVVIRGELY